MRLASLSRPFALSFLILSILSFLAFTLALRSIARNLRYFFFPFSLFNAVFFRRSCAACLALRAACLALAILSLCFCFFSLSLALAASRAALALSFASFSSALTFLARLTAAALALLLRSLDDFSLEAFSRAPWLFFLAARSLLLAERSLPLAARSLARRSFFLDRSLPLRSLERFSSALPFFSLFCALSRRSLACRLS